MTMLMMRMIRLDLYVEYSIEVMYSNSISM
jgi:hypothetical protein